MVTKEQAVSAGYRATFHYTGRNGGCKRTVGPRGGVTESIVSVRASGACQIWKRDAGRFRLPVKYGLYESSAIEQTSAVDFHLASDCPLLSE
jgi:hypothetical protein